MASCCATISVSRIQSSIRFYSLSRKDQIVLLFEQTIVLIVFTIADLKSLQVHKCTCNEIVK